MGKSTAKSRSHRTVDRSQCPPFFSARIISGETVEEKATVEDLSLRGLCARTSCAFEKDSMAEIELNVLIRQCLNRRIASLTEVQRTVSAWQTHRDNLDAKIRAFARATDDLGAEGGWTVWQSMFSRRLYRSPE